jgi:hypothetical protein
LAKCDRRASLRLKSDAALREIVGRSNAALGRCAEKVADQCGDLIRGRVQCEVASVKNVDFGLRHIPAIGFRLRDIERGIMLALDHQQARLPVTHPILPLGVGIDIGAVIVEHVALNVGLGGLTEERKFIDPQIGIIAIHIGITPDMTRSRRLE